MTETEIRAKYQNLHDNLTAAYYDGTSGLTKEQFDIQHAQIWVDMETELLAGGFIPPPDPDAIRAAELLATSPDVITQPHIWELLRIIGRRLGYIK